MRGSGALWPPAMVKSGISGRIVQKPHQHEQGWTMRKPGILIVDDDDSVLVMISEWLTKYGYEVFATLNIAGALNIFQRHRESIDMLMTDIKLQNESGFDLADILERDYGFTNHVFCTSFFWDEATAEELLRRGKPYFEKPLKFKREILPFLEKIYIVFSLMNPGKDLVPDLDEFAKCVCYT